MLNGLNVLREQVILEFMQAEGAKKEYPGVMEDVTTITSVAEQVCCVIVCAVNDISLKLTVCKQEIVIKIHYSLYFFLLVCLFTDSVILCFS